MVNFVALDLIVNEVNLRLYAAKEALKRASSINSKTLKHFYLVEFSFHALSVYQGYLYELASDKGFLLSSGNSGNEEDWEKLINDLKSVCSDTRELLNNNQIQSFLKYIEATIFQWTNVDQNSITVEKIAQQKNYQASKMKGIISTVNIDSEVDEMNEITANQWLKHFENILDRQRQLRQEW